MLTVRTYIAPSSIHGIGCFASEFIPQGKVIGRWFAEFDKIISVTDMDRFHGQIKRDFILLHAYKWNGFYHLNCDNMRFFNHSPEPNTYQTANEDTATRDIEIGEEITCNYYLFDEDADYKLKGSNVST